MADWSAAASGLKGPKRQKLAQAQAKAIYEPKKLNAAGIAKYKSRLNKFKTGGK